MKTSRKFLSIIMAVVILFSGITAFPVTALDNESTVTTENEDLTVSGTNSTGNLIANALSDVQAEQEENNGYNVFSATVEENVVVLEVETLEDCTVAVGIYDEAGTKLITSGYSPLTAGETSVMVVLETEEMPQYFYLRAFLVDSNTFRPISTSYECPNYTQEMQEFLAKTTENFEADRVVNFDDSVDNNFAVYDDATIIIPESSTGNDVASVDDETGVYVIENADESITSLQAGDIFAYEYSEDNILIVKVASITIDGTTATITGEETTLEEVFEYVKIDTSASTEDATVDTSTLDEGVSYEGIVEIEEEESNPTYGVEAEGKLSKAFSFDMIDAKIGDDDNYVKIDGGLGYEVDATIKVYISWNYQYLELKIDNTLNIDFSIHAQASGEISLFTIGFAPVPGVFIEFTPSVVVDCNASIEFNAVINMTVGFTVSSNEGMKNISTAPTVKTSLKAEGTIYVGLVLEPKIKIIHDSIAKAGLKATIGAEIKAELDNRDEKSEDYIHNCSVCFCGVITGKWSFSFNVKILNSDTLSWTITIAENTFKIADFYYSASYNRFGIGSCPYMNYTITVNIVDTAGRTIPYAEIAIDGQTGYANKNGRVIISGVPSGTYTITASKTGYISGSKNVTVKNSPIITKIVVTEKALNLSMGRLQTISAGGYCSAAITTSGNLYMWGKNSQGQLGVGNTYNYKSPVWVMSNVDCVSAGTMLSAAITTNNNLYTWGHMLTEANTITDRLKPMKMMSNVDSVSVGMNNVAAITTNGDLYTWGRNTDGELGDGSTEWRGYPLKIMSNVAVVDCSDYHHVAAITKNGDLYVWGDNSHGQLGTGDTTDRLRPVKIMSNVVDVSLGAYHSAAITKNGDLYIWGYNSKGQLGIGTTTDRLRPVKIMSSVADVSLGGSHSAAVKKNGYLYVWGMNLNGQVGIGERTSEETTPIKVMSGVASVDLGMHCTSAVTVDGDLYMWGYNNYGQIGVGTAGHGNYVLSPTWIMSNIKIPTTNYSVYNNTNTFYSDTVTENTDTSTEGTTDTETDTGITEDTTTDTTTPTEKTVEYTGLIANEVYNFYVMKDRESELPFGADNLLYMTQAVSDADGNLSITYTPTAECDTADIFLKGMSLTDISTSHTVSHDIVYNRTENLATIDVLYNGEYLEEGLDYEITESQISKDIGTYTATITGIGDYTGTLTTTYEVYCGHDYNTGKCIMCGHNKGDADANGEINADDYTLMANASAAAAVIEDDVARCDMNGDGVVDGFDAIILDLKNNNMLQSTVTGDANGDGMVDDNDYTFLSSVINGETAITDNVTRLCDLNSDGAITSDDLTMLESYLNGSLDWV